MKKLRLFVVILLVSVCTACAQQQKYISYTVKEGETVKSIATDLGIKPKEIFNLNPSLSKKPDINTVIIVPNVKYEVEDAKNETEIVIPDGVQTHTVQPKEGLYGIAKKYDTTIAELKETNDITGTTISIGQVLIIPEKKVALDSTKVYHKVVKDDTVFSLSKTYEVSQDSLEVWNPTLKKDGLKLGMFLIVGLLDSESEADAFLEPFEDKITKKELRVLLMLPYKLDATSSVENSFEKQNSLLNIVTDFHLGAQLAIENLKSQGMKVDVDVVDTQNKKSKVDAILNATDNAKDYDVVIGPLFFKNAAYVAKKTKQIPVVAPMYSKQQSKVLQSNLIKASPGKLASEKVMIDYMLRNYDGEKVIVVADNTDDVKQQIDRLTIAFKSLDSTQKVTLLQPKDGYIKREKFAKAIDTIKRKSWVVLLGEDHIVTADVVNNLGVMPQTGLVKLFSYNKGGNFDNVSNQHLERLSFTYTDQTFIDETNEIVKEFMVAYRKANFIYPTQYAIKGYDITYDTLMRLSQEKSFDKGAEQGYSNRIASKFCYASKGIVGAENKGVFILQYQEGLTVVPVE